MRPGQRASDETRAKMSAARNAPGVRERQAAAIATYWTPQRREEARQRALAVSSDPSWRAKVRVRTAEAMADPARKARHVDGVRKAMAKPEVRGKIAKRMREAMADPAARDRILHDLTQARAHPERAMRAADGIRASFELDHIAVDLRGLEDAWRAARPAARNQFLADLFGPLFAVAGKPS